MSATHHTLTILIKQCYLEADVEYQRKLAEKTTKPAYYQGVDAALQHFEESNTDTDGIESPLRKKLRRDTVLVKAESIYAK